jgi:predicted ATP-grasp superfamily ATP-dependent carboligase
MKKNVLVFPCGSEIGLEIYKSASNSTHFKLIGGSSVNDHGSFVYKNYISNIPMVNEEDFIEKINKIIDDHDIDIIIPAHDDVVLKLAEGKTKGNLNCEVLTSVFRTCEIARSKLKTYEHLKDIVLTPRVYRSSEEINEKELPVFLKPDIGQGSKGTFIANTLEEVSFYSKDNEGTIITEYLPGREFTVDCFTNSNNELLFSEGRERKRISSGISVNSVTIDDERFVKIAKKLNETLKFNGVWFFQLKENKQGDLVLMEFAPRIAGTMGLVRCRGVNLVMLGLFNAFGANVSIIENSYNLEIDRALGNRYKHDIDYKNVYIDFDDLIIFEEKVSLPVVTFIYQCFNKKIKLYLITKHKDNLDMNLKKFRLQNIFDEIIWIQDGENKWEHIKEPNSIFIDDSYSERKQVSDMLHIPVFDQHMIESLIETF